jgi:hypothetical protein
VGVNAKTQRRKTFTKKKNQMSKERKTTADEKTYDERYQFYATWWHRLIIRLFRRHINLIVGTILSRAFERSHIDSFAMHEMAGCCNRILWPNSSSPPRRSVVQIGNVCAGDMAGGDIVKNRSL